jgi:putative transposase
LPYSKKKRLPVIECSHKKAIEQGIKSSVSGLCKKVKMSRQNYYKEHQKRQRKEVDELLILDLAKAERQLQPRLGGKKLYHFLLPELESAGIDTGRDRFLEILYTNDLKLDKLPKGPQTTNSSHSLGVFHNEVRNMIISAPNQAWASDITYIRVANEFMYLSLITDMCSRKIVGYNFSNEMKAIDCCKALDMALKTLPKGARPVHHSDRGCQYCSHELR